MVDLPRRPPPASGLRAAPQEALEPVQLVLPERDAEANLVGMERVRGGGRVNRLDDHVEPLVHAEYEDRAHALPLGIARGIVALGRGELADVLAADQHRATEP